MSSKMCQHKIFTLAHKNSFIKIIMWDYYYEYIPWEEFIVSRTQRKKSHLQFQLWYLSHTVNTLTPESCVCSKVKSMFFHSSERLAQKYQEIVLPFWVTILSVKGVCFLGQNTWMRQESLMKTFSPSVHVLLILQRPKIQDWSQKLN